ncbi:hypothetical protein AS9A_4504 [Hoyosella subflava DQS3-9A1]|uniref:Uncharacterized protein n=1 Tax=Hoyosella subflava (strain DSM 45089 / JCM 17490 / NBRC 109087 / DQS3-9A1) TaxID=443218 RepID=F6ENS9_HOYSD|nr:hypothetical protein AS9A_4504 [Hoyosella subflava DQS3-9A1]
MPSHDDSNAKAHKETTRTPPVDRLLIRAHPAALDAGVGA